MQFGVAVGEFLRFCALERQLSGHSVQAYAADLRDFRKWLGADVAINYRSKRPKAQAVADELIAMGRKPLLIEADITKAEDIAAIIGQIEAAWRQLDLLI